MHETKTNKNPSGIGEAEASLLWAPYNTCEQAPRYYLSLISAHQ